MRLHRFIFPNLVLKSEEIGIPDHDLVKQLRTVLRIKVGDSILVSDGEGLEAEGVVKEYRGDSVIVSFGEPYEVKTEPGREVTLCMAVTKRDTFEWACQKATECGVTRIVPVITERTVKQNISLSRLRAIVKEASEQSGRGVIPEIDDITPFEDLVVSVQGEKFIAAVGHDETPLDDVSRGEESVTVFIGPEGGFSEKEVALAEHNGWRAVTLGSRVLRAETAAVIATYLLAV
jgi:16S rRNA (uracil1498-N3)-methyltransferase